MRLTIIAIIISLNLIISGYFYFISDFSMFNFALNFISTFIMLVMVTEYAKLKKEQKEIRRIYNDFKKMDNLMKGNKVLLTVVGSKSKVAENRKELLSLEPFESEVSNFYHYN